MLNICLALLKNKELDDILIIGSFVKGKENPGDIDLCFIFNKYNDGLIKKAYSLFEKKNLTVHITKTRFSNLFIEPQLWQTIIHEGYSVQNKQEVSKLLNMQPFMLFEYNLKNLDATKKQTFSHALYGTGGRVSFLGLNKGSKLGKSSVIVPIETSEQIREFLNTWGIVYKVRRIWL